MALYYPLCIDRSDGLFEVITKNGTKEPNQPTAEQMDDTPDANGNIDCYRKLEPDSEKAADWRRKIGGMIIHYLGGNQEQFAGKNYILKEFPEGYTLWEHVKYNKNKLVEDRKKEKGSSRHAAGIYERQDAYLYGSPQGRKKRYRSPADFFHHVIWLVCDQEGDPANCTCKICSPDGDITSADSPVKNDPDEKQLAPLKKPTPTSKPTTKSLQPSSTAAPALMPPSKSAPPARQANTRSQEQIADGDPKLDYLFRPGELVWFNITPNWRLGVIGKRGLVNLQPNYLIQPLSNPMQHQPQQIKNETSLRPWLAWSVPKTTNNNLNDVPFEQVPWARVVAGDFDAAVHRDAKPDYVVDGSILAAKMIDASYSLFERKENALAGPGEVHYNGMFLGGEKIWVGEPIRLRVPPNPGQSVPDMVVMVIHKLIERTIQGRSSVTFVGDIYKFVEMPSPYTDRKQWPTPDLPARMVADLRFRNETADNAHARLVAALRPKKKPGDKAPPPAPCTWYEWRLLEPAARRDLGDIRGRWYETRTLLPILMSGSPYYEQYQQDIENGKVDDAVGRLNSRRDNNMFPEQRKKNRRDTLGESVPTEFKVSRGLDGPAADNVFPNDQQVRAPPQFDGTADIEQFMDLDGGNQEFYA